MSQQLVKEDDLRRLWADPSLRVSDMAISLGVSASSVRKVARELGLPARTAGGRSTTVRHAEPTPEELEQRCAEVRSRWRRSDDRYQPVEVRAFSYSRTSCTFHPM